ncbi:hypothetical protein BDN72DRAFT_864106 [Pluteus cervinus]|uniref:Uncharacterized protein n=1 Tax=Pluteus cervinus TaxID=181527 RepID=A0ACD3A5E5_9AGAR|nr:hypothetical protein BDN72DRAFT_864106 [Pluteus cervinus]
MIESTDDLGGTIELKVCEKGPTPAVVVKQYTWVVEQNKRKRKLEEKATRIRRRSANRKNGAYPGRKGFGQAEIPEPSPRHYYTTTPMRWCRYRGKATQRGLGGGRQILRNVHTWVPGDMKEEQVVQTFSDDELAIMRKDKEQKRERSGGTASPTVSALSPGRRETQMLESTSIRKDDETAIHPRSFGKSKGLAGGRSGRWWWEVEEGEGKGGKTNRRNRSEWLKQDRESVGIVGRGNKNYQVGNKIRVFKLFPVVGRARQRSEDDLGGTRTTGPPGAPIPSLGITHQLQTHRRRTKTYEPARMPWLWPGVAEAPLVVHVFIFVTFESNCVSLLLLDLPNNQGLSVVCTTGRSSRNTALSDDWQSYFTNGIYIHTICTTKVVILDHHLCYDLVIPPRTVRSPFAADALENETVFNGDAQKGGRRGGVVSVVQENAFDVVTNDVEIFVAREGWWKLSKKPAFRFELVVSHLPLDSSIPRRLKPRFNLLFGCQWQPNIPLQLRRSEPPIAWSGCSARTRPRHEDQRRRVLKGRGGVFEGWGMGINMCFRRDLGIQAGEANTTPPTWMLVYRHPGFLSFCVSAESTQPFAFFLAFFALRLSLLSRFAVSYSSFVFTILTSPNSLRIPFEMPWLWPGVAEAPLEVRIWSRGRSVFGQTSKTSQLAFCRMKAVASVVIHDYHLSYSLTNVCLTVRFFHTTCNSGEQRVAIHDRHLAAPLVRLFARFANWVNVLPQRWQSTITTLALHQVWCHSNPHKCGVLR